MTVHHATARAMLALTAALWAGAVQAVPGIPPGGSLNFKVLRDGDEVGTHTLHFAENAGATRVEVETHVNVTLPFLGVSVYHFDHQGAETWRDGALVALESRTDDDGDAHQLTVTRSGDRLHVRSENGEHHSAGTLLPASLWNPGLVHHRVLLNTLDGREMPVAVSDEGEETIEVNGATVRARHYRLTGGLNRELWYDPQGVLVKVSFAAKDDSRIDYVLP